MALAARQKPTNATSGLEQRVALVEHARRRGGREHEDVLRPLLGPGGLERGLQRRRPVGRSGVRGGVRRVARGRLRGRRLGGRFGGRGHRGQARRTLVGRPGPSGRRLRRTWRRRSTRAQGDDGTTGLLFGGRVGKDTAGPDAYGAVDEAVSALGLARAEAERGSELDELLIRLQRELFVVGAELATAPDNRAKLDAGRVAHHRGDGRRARADHRPHHRALRPAHRVRAAGREPPRRRARPRPHRRAARRAPGRRRHPRTAGWATRARSCPTSTASPTSCTPSPAGRRVTSGRSACAPEPHRPDAPPEPPPPSPPERNPVPLSFTVSSTAPDRVAVDLLAVPVAKWRPIASSARAPTSSTPRSAAGSPRSSRRPASTARSATPSRCPPRAAARPGRDPRRRR